MEASCAIMNLDQGRALVAVLTFQDGITNAPTYRRQEAEESILYLA